MVLGSGLSHFSRSIFSLVIHFPSVIVHLIQSSFSREVCFFFLPHIPYAYNTLYVVLLAWHRKYTCTAYARHIIRHYCRRHSRQINQVSSVFFFLFLSLHIIFVKSSSLSFFFFVFSFFHWLRSVLYV